MSSVRVRFAPAPTGFMHLGNVRAALINFLYAKAHGGVFVVRVEDTDQQRNFDVGATHILADLAWLSLTYDEGPQVGGAYGPYFQSERGDIYRRYLEQLIAGGALYQCFCTPEELEAKRQRQVALKQAPRYDRTCLKLSPEVITERLAAGIAYVWRLKVPARTVVMHDLARGAVTFDLVNFSDPALTRTDGSVTFLCANFIDDMLMKITHVFRGEDHISNTALQLVLYEFFGVPVPVFWHLPIMATVEGKKLSKRDFGFSLQDLRDAGYLPEAIVNYLAIIGGGSYQQEIMPLSELVQLMADYSVPHASQVKYDVEKLNWVNHQWMMRLSALELLNRLGEVSVSQARALKIIELVRPEATTLGDVRERIRSFSDRPIIGKAAADAVGAGAVVPVLMTVSASGSGAFFATLSAHLKAQGVAPRAWYPVVRLALTGDAQGSAVSEIVSVLGEDEARERIKLFCQGYTAR